MVRTDFNLKGESHIASLGPVCGTPQAVSMFRGALTGFQNSKISWRVASWPALAGLDVKSNDIFMKLGSGQ
jgi:hypothetical protein